MLIFLFFALFIAILAIIFAVQNNATTMVSFFIWDFEGSLALILLISLATGALISFLASLPTNVKNRLKLRSLRKKVTELENKLAKTTTAPDQDIDLPPPATPKAEKTGDINHEIQDEP